MKISIKEEDAAIVYKELTRVMRELEKSSKGPSELYAKIVSVRGLFVNGMERVPEIEGKSICTECGNNKKVCCSEGSSTENIAIGGLRAYIEKVVHVLPVCLECCPRHKDK